MFKYLFLFLFSASSLTHLEHGAAVRPTESSGRSERTLELLEAGANVRGKMTCCLREETSERVHAF